MVTFTLTEDEFNDLGSIKGQLAFVNALASGHASDRIEVSPADLVEFLAQLETMATRIFENLLERQETAREELNTW
jgi:hypothetical protein